MARRLADKHEVGRRIAHSEHDLLPPEAVQLAARAVAKVGADGRQRVGRRHVNGTGVVPLFFTQRARKGHDPFFAPCWIATHAADAKFLREPEMFLELIAVHRIVRLKANATS